MSGTSFDGVDAALIRTDGINHIEVIDSAFLEYDNKEKKLYKSSVLQNLKKITNVIDNRHIEVIHIFGGSIPTVRIES